MYFYRVARLDVLEGVIARWRREFCVGEEGCFVALPAAVFTIAGGDGEARPLVLGVGMGVCRLQRFMRLAAGADVNSRVLAPDGMEMSRGV